MSERLYSLLLWLYPPAFRERHAEEMAQLFRDRLRDERAARVWMDVLLDAARSIPRQHMLRGPHPFYPPSAAPLMRATATAILLTIVATAMVTALAGVALGLAIGSAVSGRHHDTIVWLMSLPAGWLLAGLLLVVSFITARRACRVTQTLKTFHAEVGGDAVTVAWHGAAPLSVARSEVVGVHVFERIGLRIQTIDPARDLWVPVKAAAYPRVKESLSAWAPVTVTPFRLTGDRVPGFFQLTVLHTLALFLPMALAGFVVGALLIHVPAALAKRDLPLHRRLLPLGPMVILLARWWS